jgi:phosphate/sulfate permease
VDWRRVREMIGAWIITLPTTAALAFTIYSIVVHGTA